MFAKENSAMISNKNLFEIVITDKKKNIRLKDHLYTESGRCKYVTSVLNGTKASL